MVDDRGFGVPLPSTGEDRWYKVYGLRGEGPERFGFYGRIWLGKLTHFDDCTFPCDETPTCKGCNQKNGTKAIGNRWNGYIAGYSFHHKEDCVIALTEGAANQLLPTYKQRGTLQGLVIELYRKRKDRNKPPAKNAPVWVRELEKNDPAKSPQPFPIEYSILRMWGIHAAFTERKKIDARTFRINAGMPSGARQPDDDHIPI